MISNVEKAINSSKKVESLLVEQFAATGRGLHEKLSSIERALPEDVIKKIRWIATIRNNLVHEEAFEFNEMKELLHAVDEVAEFLEAKDEHGFPDALIDEFQPSKNYKIQLNLKNPPSEQKISSARKQNAHEDKQICVIATVVSAIIIVLLMSAIIGDWKHLPFDSIQKINGFLWWLTNVGASFLLIFSFIVFAAGCMTFFDTELAHLKEAESLEYIEKIAAIKKKNPIVNQYVQKVGKMGRKLLHEEADYLEEFHLWKLDKDRASLLKKKEAMLYE